MLGYILISIQHCRRKTSNAIRLGHSVKLLRRIKNSSPSGENRKDGTKGKDGANGITITGKPGSTDSNIVEEDTQLDNSTTIASNASASTSAMDNSGAANPFGLPM